jgi:hypothetical protein
VLLEVVHLDDDLGGLGGFSAHDGKCNVTYYVSIVGAIAAPGRL